MSKAYNIPYGEDEWIIAKDGTSITPDDTWNIEVKYQGSCDLHESPFTGQIDAIKMENFRTAVCYWKNIPFATYSTLKGWEGSDVTLTPHSDENTITYTMRLQRAEIRYNKSDYRDWTGVVYLTQDKRLP
jgi:hypothetical protein